MTTRQEKLKEGRDAFNNLAVYSFQSPYRLNPYNDSVDSDAYRYWREGWDDAIMNFWEILGSD